MSNVQVVNLADNINAAVLKINQNFAGVEAGDIGGGLDSAEVVGVIIETVDSAYVNNLVDVPSPSPSSVDSSDIPNLVNNILDSDYFLTTINQEYLQQFTVNTDVIYLDSDISANASAIFQLTSRIDATDSGILVLSQALIQTQADLDGLVLGGIDSDILASAIASANTSLISRIEANSDQIVSFAGIIDSVENNLLLFNSDTNDRIDLNTSAISSLTSRITANESGLTAVVSSVDSLGLSLDQFITDGIEITPEQVTSAIGGALDELTLRLDADSDKLILEATKIVDLNTQLTALDSETGAQIQAEADARNVLSSTVALIDGRVTSQSSDITTLTANVDSDFARIDNELSVIVDDLGNVSAVYALNLDVNNHIAGIRLDNDGNTANFAVTADTFKVINASNNEIQPFTVIGDDVFLSNATVTGNLDVTTSGGTGSMNIKGELITISDGNGTPRIKLGDLSA